MRRIFLDANIYLEFYQVGWKEFPKLLSSLKAIEADIFVTEQIRAEVERNKLGITVAASQELLKRGNLNGTRLEASLAASYTEKFGRTWPSFDKSEIEIANRNLSDLVKDRVTKVARSNDEVSESLKGILSKAKECTQDELERARFRKERGNPPGKRGDPLGDQLSWEQLKGTLSKGDQVWIITKDKDYSWGFQEVVFLNPILQNELKAVGIGASDIHVFDSLTLALTELSKIKPLETLPEPAVMAAAEKEERSRVALGEPGIPGSCYRCGEVGTITNGHWGRSQYGGLTWQYMCRNCGANFDTGEPYDD